MEVPIASSVGPLLRLVLSSPSRASALRTLTRTLSRARWPLAACLILVAVFAGALSPAVAPARAAGPLRPLGTNVSGTLPASTTWTTAGSPYVITSDLFVPANVTLTIQPGVQVQIASRMWLVVQSGGRLVAGQAGGATVTFTSVAPLPTNGNRYHIRVDAGGSAAFNNCDVSNAGYNDTAALLIHSSDVQVLNSRIHDNGNDGILIGTAGIRPTLQNLTIDRNGGFAIRQGSANVNPTYSNLTLTGNGTNAVYVPGDTLSQDVTLNGGPGTLNGRYFFVNYDLYVGAGATLTVTPGTDVRFNGNTWLVTQNGGKLVAQGTPAQPISFTSGLATPVPGAWRHIRIEAGGAARLSECLIRHAGTASEAGLRIMATDVQVRNCRIVDHAGNGVSLEGIGIRPTLENLTIANNAGFAVAQTTANMQPTYRNLTMAGNGTNAVFLPGDTLSQDVTIDGGPGTLNGQYYFINYDLYVGAGKTLTITPGTDVRFNGNTWLVTQNGGKLMAQGTPTQPISFTSGLATPVPGAWRHIRIEAGGAARLAQCDISYAGTAGEAALRIFAHDVQVRNCRIHDNASDGVSVDGVNIRPTLASLTITNNPGYAVRQGINAAPAYGRLNATANGANIIYLPGGPVSGGPYWDFGAAGLPALVGSDLSVPAGNFLSLAPGTTVQFITNTWLDVAGGGLYAIGTPTAAVTLTGAVDQPGTWWGVRIHENANAILQNCNLLDGGRSNSPLLLLASSSALVQNCRIANSAADGIQTASNAQPSISYNQIYSNSFGLRNTSAITVDARSNWWGDPSGPTHASNLTGRGDKVSDKVLFDPWLTSPTTGAGAVGRLLLQVAGPKRASPGQAVDYAVAYANFTQQTVNDAVVVMMLPVAAQYVESTGGGIYWPERHEVFWKLGNVAYGGRGTLTARLRYNWGIPDAAQDTTLALLAGTNAGQAAFDVTPYLSYAARSITGKAALAASELQAERSTYADLDKIYNEALAGGFTLGEASRLNLSSGEPVVQVTLLKGSTGAVMYLRRQGPRVEASTFDRTSYAIRDATGGITQNLQLNTVQYWGSWAARAGTLQAQGLLSSAECFGNCVLENMPGWLVSNKIKAIGAILNAADCFDCVRLGDEAACAKCAGTLSTLPGAGEAIDTIKCGKECSENPDSHLCKSDKVTCDKSWWNIYYWLDVPQKKIIRCQNGRYNFLPEIIPCAFGDKCVEDQGCVSCGSSSALSAQGGAATTTDFCYLIQAAGGTCSTQKTDVRVARDPNAKYGPAGDLLPGQSVSYTITFENEGAGDAFGVFVVDPLSEFFDDSSLAIFGGGRLITASRTIVWQVGDLKPKGQAGSTGAISFTVKLKAGLPSGTIIMNQATVYFPSVPEETPTNPVVNLVQTLAAQPQEVQTAAGQAVAITLQGVEASGRPLTFTLLANPLNGRLSGTAPNLTYTPTANFSGQDRFRFKVSNGITESRAAEVSILVNPSASDSTAPEVLWTAPAANARLAAVRSTPVLTDSAGAGYAPAIVVQFGEALSVTTVTTATVRLAGAGGRAVAFTVGYDDFARQVAITPRRALGGERYTVTLTRGVKDVVGNALAADYSFSFDVGGAAAVEYKVYLPATFNKFSAGW